PVAGSSTTPRSGANMRLYTVARSGPCSAVNRKTPFAFVPADWSSESYSARLRTALSTARRVASGTNRNGTPHETTWTGLLVPETAAADSDNAAAARAGSGIGSPKVGFGCVIHTKRRSSPFQLSATG